MASPSGSRHAGWDLAADALSALGHPIRLKLIQEVLNGASTTVELCAPKQRRPHGSSTTNSATGDGGMAELGCRGRYEIPAARVIPLRRHRHGEPLRSSAGTVKRQLEMKRTT